MRWARGIGIAGRKERWKRWRAYLEAIFVGGDEGGAWAGAERWPLRDWGMGEAAVEERYYQ